jgi:hypothetical protein
MSSSIDAINQANQASSIITLTFTLTNLVLGSIGLVINLLVFTRPSLRQQPFSVYFLTATCTNLFIVFVVLPVRIASSAFNTDPANLNVGICKLEFFMFYSMRATSCWLIVLACANRYVNSLSSDVWRRRLNSQKTTFHAIALTLVMVPLAYSHMLVYFNLNITLNRFGQIVATCSAQPGIYATFIPLWHAALYSLCPSFFMFFFGLLTVVNIRRRRQQVGPTIVGTRSTVRRTDAELMRMLIAQVLVIVLTTFPLPIFQLYLSLTANISKSTLRIAQEKVINQTAGGLSYFAHSSSFYLYTLTGSNFRKELFKIFSPFIPLRFRQRQRLAGPAVAGTLEVAVRTIA